MPRPGAGKELSLAKQTSVRIPFERVRLKRRLRFYAVPIPLAAPAIGPAARCRLTFAVIVGDAIAQISACSRFNTSLHYQRLLRRRRLDFGRLFDSLPD